MMSLLLTLLTLAGGIFIGLAGVFLSKKKMSYIKKACAWFGLITLLFAVGAIGIWCEGKINSSHIFPFISEITTTIIIVYGIILGIIIPLGGDLKKEIEDGGKIEWLTIATSLGFTKLPLILWIILSLSNFTCWNTLTIAIIIGFTITTILYIVFGYAKLLLKHDQKKPCF